MKYEAKYLNTVIDLQCMVETLCLEHAMRVKGRYFFLVIEHSWTARECKETQNKVKKIHHQVRGQRRFSFGQDSS